MKPTGKDNIEFQIWDDLPAEEGRMFPKRFQVYGWDAEVIDTEGPIKDAHRIMRIRFSKPGYQSMDMAVTYQLLADGSPGAIRDMFSEKVMAHQRAQELLRANAKPFQLKKEGPPPSPSGALYAEDGEFGKPSNLPFDPDKGAAALFKKLDLTISEVGIKATISDVLQATESAQLKSMAMMSTQQMRESMDMMMEKSAHPSVDLGYAAMIAPMVKKDLYSQMYPQVYPQEWVKTAVPDGPEARDEGDWA